MTLSQSKLKEVLALLHVQNRDGGALEFVKRGQRDSDIASVARIFLAHVFAKKDALPNAPAQHK